jgi:hypothetical protein
MTQFAISQSNQVVLEQVQMYSSISPDGNYWQPNKTQIQAFVNALDTGLFNRLQLVRDTSYATNLKILTKPNQIGKLVIDWSKSKNLAYHAYLEIYELLPEQTYRNEMVNIVIPKKDSIESTWFLTCTILDEKKTPVFQKTVLMGMIPVDNQGVGYPINIPVTTPKSIFKALVSGIHYLNEAGTELEYIEAKVSTSFATDNFIMPMLQSKQRISIDTSKGFLKYNQYKTNIILRIPNAIMNKIDHKDKSINNPFYAVLPEIKKRNSTLFKEYYQAVQPLRNVKENKDYTLEAFIEFNPLIDPELRAVPPIRFLPNSLHKIFADTSLIGRFKVVEQPLNKAWMYNSNEVYNGVDSSSIFKLKSSYPKGPILFSKSVEGNIGKDAFKILFNDDIDVKIIYLNNVATMVAQGKKKPTNLIQVEQINQNTLSALLLMIAYSEIFQSPN